MRSAAPVLQRAPGDAKKAIHLRNFLRVAVARCRPFGKMADASSTIA
jgi:hypothetical protein